MPGVATVSRKNTHKGCKGENTRVRAGLSEIVHQLAIPTFVIDTAHVVTNWNRACERLTGYSAKRMLGRREAWKAFYQNPRPTLADLVVTHHGGGDGVGHGAAAHIDAGGVEQTAGIELLEHGGDTAGPVQILNVMFPAGAQ